jgi:hypothetical protein
MGGLGNQIFQIFATISYAIKSRNEFKFLNVNTLGGASTTIRNTFWDSFFSRLKPFLIESVPQSIHIIREKDFTFNELPVYEMLGHDTLIFGYFQSYKYFEDNYPIISRLIDLEKMKKNIKDKIEGLYNNLNLQNCISMHFRIGDYKKIQHVHPIMTKNYYYKALNFIKNNYFNSKFKYTVIYFCEDSDLEDVNSIIDYLQEEFKEHKLFDFVRGENSLSDWEQLLFMSCCHDNIIANSSFSWWAAYFNSWEDKIVCYPSTWFGPSAPHNTKDLCPNSWHKIQV